MITNIALQYLLSNQNYTNEDFSVEDRRCPQCGNWTLEINYNSRVVCGTCREDFGEESKVIYYNDQIVKMPTREEIDNVLRESLSAKQDSR